MVNYSVELFMETEGAKDLQLPVGWMINHQEVAGGGEDPEDMGEVVREALEAEGWEIPNFLPKGWTARIPWRRQKMVAITAFTSQSKENVTCVSICLKEKTLCQATLVLHMQ